MTSQVRVCDMKDDWKDELCETCFYCIEKKCRRFPPTASATGWSANYPTVLEKHKACAEWTT